MRNYFVWSPKPAQPLFTVACPVQTVHTYNVVVQRRMKMDSSTGRRPFL